MQEQSGLYKDVDKLGTLLSNWRNRVALRYVKGELVDLACGDNTLVRTHGQGKGVDIYDYGNVDVVCENFCVIPIESETVDTVTIIASLNYFSDPAGTLKEAHRMLKNEGNVVLTMSNIWIMKIWHMFREPHARKAAYTNRDVRSFLKEAGFELVTKKYFMFFVNKVYVARKN